jgi:hypothetical protein
MLSERARVGGNLIGRGILSDDRKLNGKALGRMFVVDEQGLREMEALQEQFLARIHAIEAASKRRCADSGEEAKPVLAGVYRRHEQQSMN